MSFTKMLTATAAAALFAISTLAMAYGGSADKDKMAKDIVGTAAANQDFSTLVAAVKAAGLVETLQGDGPFTVFAPTNEAFSKMPEGTVENLLKPENRDQLVSILKYHVVPGKVMASDVVNLSTATTAEGDSINIQVDSGRVMIDNAEVITTDIEASNGVIHVIDTVILPGSAS